MNIVKYHNDINKLKIGNFTEKETDIFFTLLLKARESNDEIILMNFAELKSMIEGNRSEERLITNIRELNKKLKMLVQEIQDINGDYIMFSLFGDIITSPSKKTLEVSINPRFKHLIYDLIGNFTLLDLKELVSLKGTYPKTLYRLLKQWESTGKLLIDLKEFRELMGIPETYKMFNIDQKVLYPCLEDLEKYFKNLNVMKIKRGVKVVSLEFSWRKRKVEKESKQLDVYVVNQHSEKLGTLSDSEEKKALEILKKQGITKEYLEQLKKKSINIYLRTLRQVLI